MMNQPHQIPLHLETEDKFLWTLTGRQVCIIGLGLAVGYLVFVDLTVQVSLLFWLLGLFLWVCFALAGVVVAFVRVQRRNLEEWALVWLLYWSRSRYYLWRPLPEENDTPEHEENNIETKEENNRW